MRSIQCIYKSLEVPKRRSVLMSTNLVLREVCFGWEEIFRIILSKGVISAKQTTLFEFLYLQKEFYAKTLLWKCFVRIVRAFRNQGLRKLLQFEKSCLYIFFPHLMLIYGMLNDVFFFLLPLMYRFHSCCFFNAIVWRMFPVILEIEDLWIAWIIFCMCTFKQTLRKSCGEMFN